MKNKILILVIGILIGAIITTSAFLIYNKAVVKSPKEPETMRMDRNGQMQLPANGNMQEPPQVPNGNGGAPKQLPSNLSNNNNYNGGNL